MGVQASGCRESRYTVHEAEGENHFREGHPASPPPSLFFSLPPRNEEMVQTSSVRVSSRESGLRIFGFGVQGSGAEGVRVQGIKLGG